MSKLLIKPLEKHISEHDIATGSHSINFCSWQRLIPQLKEVSGFKDIKGIRVTKQGIEILEGDGTREWNKEGNLDNQAHFKINKNEKVNLNSFCIFYIDANFVYRC